MTQRSIYFQAAGFNIKIEFAKSKRLIANDRLREALIKQLSGFMIESKGIVFDFTIKVVYCPELLFGRTTKVIYAPIFNQLQTNKAEISYYNSLDHFNSALLEILNQLLIKHNGFILHASACVFQGKPLIFLGKTNNGKSTVVQLLLPEAKILADDHLLVRRIKNDYNFFQSPLIERNPYPKFGLINYRIDSLYLLQKSKCCETKKVASKDYLAKLLPKLVAFPKLVSSDLENNLSRNVGRFIEEQNFQLLSFGLDKKKLKALL